MQYSEREEQSTLLFALTRGSRDNNPTLPIFFLLEKTASSHRDWKVMAYMPLE